MRQKQPDKSSVSLRVNATYIIQIVQLHSLARTVNAAVMYYSWLQRRRRNHFQARYIVLLQNRWLLITGEKITAYATHKWLISWLNWTKLTVCNGVNRSKIKHWLTLKKLVVRTMCIFTEYSPIRLEYEITLYSMYIDLNINQQARAGNSLTIPLQTHQGISPVFGYSHITPNSKK